MTTEEKDAVVRKTLHVNEGTNICVTNTLPIEQGDPLILKDDRLFHLVEDGPTLVHGIIDEWYGVFISQKAYDSIVAPLESPRRSAMLPFIPKED